MKKLAVIILITVSAHTYGQQYYCPVASTSGTTFKADQWINIMDSLVVIKVKSKQVNDSTTFIRKPSLNKSIVYVTDQVVTGSLTISPMNGSIKGTRYSETLAYKPDINANTVLIYYCTPIKPKSE